MTAETITPNDDAVASCDHQKQLDHIDQMCHEIQQKLAQFDPLLPHLPRVLGWFERGKWWGAKNAVPQRETAPVHVGEASEDRPPLGA